MRIVEYGDSTRTHTKFTLLTVLAVSLPQLAFGGPIIINTVADLENINNNLSGSYVLGGNIDASATASWNGGAGFVPIGDGLHPFTGTLSGNGFTISNLTINRNSNNAGLFESLSGTVSNIGLTNINARGSFIGAIAAINKGTITQTYATGSINGHVAGGLVGVNQGTVNQSYSRVNVKAVVYGGGLTGDNSDAGGLIKGSYATGAVTRDTNGNLGFFHAGGLAGENGAAGLTFLQPILVNSYWDTQATGQASSTGFSSPGSTSNVAGFTTSQFQSGALPIGFDPAVWRATPGQYPTLQWQSSSPAPPTSPSCSSIIHNRVSIPDLGDSSRSLSGQPTSITAQFVPAFGLTLAQAAAACGVLDFNWQQTILNIPSPSPYYAATAPTIRLTAPSGGFNDAPPGGYTYEPVCSYVPHTLIPLTYSSWNPYPFYYDTTTPSSDCMSLLSHKINTLSDPTDLVFRDAPADPCLPGTILSARCGFTTAPPGSSLRFVTRLVGIGPGNTLIDLGDPSLVFEWMSTFNGTSGGIATLGSDLPVDAGSGTGGIIFLSGGPIPEPSSLLFLSAILIILSLHNYKRRLKPKNIDHMI